MPVATFVEKVEKNTPSDDAQKAVDLFELSLPDLIFTAQTVHRQHFNPNRVQMSALLSIKTGACPEDCSYCPQSIRYQTDIEAHPLLDADTVINAARCAKKNGATRFCMGAAWRGPKQKDIKEVAHLVREVKKIGLETCATLGLLQDGQAEQLKDAGLDYYNHNIDTAPEFYGNVITTRRFEQRLETLQRVKDAGINVCCGGIVGMGETRAQRAAMITTLANMDPPPQSVPINNLVQVPGTPLHGAAPIDPLEFVRTIAVARIMMPSSYVRLSAGRTEMSEAVQALCFIAGANSIFCGDKLLTTANPDYDADTALLEKLGMGAEVPR